MFTQFFGNYLLNQNLVSPEHLAEALSQQGKTRLKLGVLAINSGLLTANQVERAHREQQRTDKRIGDVMVGMGLLTNSQVENLLKAQPAGHLLLGQTLVDKGYMTTSQFEAALSAYKRENSINDEDYDGSVRRLVDRFYSFDESGAVYMTSYVSLLFRNLVRFIGDDFTPMDAHAFCGAVLKCIEQRISGGLSAITLIDADAPALIEFASRFANEKLTGDDEYTHACVSEFLNLNNGLFAVNVSNDSGLELKLEPQSFYDNIDIKSLSDACVIPVRFSFGEVDFIISM
ncbi:MAG: chemotaxis protein CheX [Ruminococcus sp.]|nr:chemotaxis protein CheX [Ruminococcus sp.]MCM1380875.1 hypothetical protein [Muribaculaceae bacterium]MCM1479616.1 hypothetical protein [Muribaculaceae bacterium]